MASGRTSGANTTPLGRPSPSFLTPNKPNTLGSSLLNPSYMSSQPVMKRDRDEDDYQSTNWPPDVQDSGKKKKKRSRWGGDEKEKVFIPGLPTVLPNNLNPQQERAYLLQLQIEEISRRLRTGDLGIPPNPEERSPSPEPIYNSEGKRLNTREYRTRKKLEDDRHSLIQEMYSVNPDYKPPADYKPPLVKVSEKVMIPQEEHPEINFVGLLIGPRGNTLKSMEKETGAKIIIRGKGSVKEGKVGRKDGQPLPGEDEPLHAFVTGNSNESVKKAVNKIREIIRQGVEVPEGQNDLRRMQLRELALLNGTLRENDGPRCTNCGATTHKSWSCPDKPNVTNNLICSNCGSAGHIAKDCREQKNITGTLGVTDKSKIDEEYMSLMAELGEGPPPPAKSISIGTTQSTANPLAPPPGPPRAVLAAPGPSQPVQVSISSSPVAVTTQPLWSGSIQSKISAIRTTAPLTPSGIPGGIQAGVQTGIQAPMLIPPPMMPPLNPASLAQPGMLPWQSAFPVPTTLQHTSAAVLGTQGIVTPVPSILAAPPPPPPPTVTQAQSVLPGAAWLAAPTVSQAASVPAAAPWQISPQQTVVAPVPPPPGVAAVPPPAGSLFPWPGFIGVPRPPSLQASLQTLAAAPPPPPPSSTVQAANTTSSVASAQSANLSSLATLPNLLSAPPPPPPS